MSEGKSTQEEGPQEEGLINLKVGTIVEGWKIDKKLGEGAFGAVYLCSKDGKSFALKVYKYRI